MVAIFEGLAHCCGVLDYFLKKMGISQPAGLIQAGFVLQFGAIENPKDVDGNVCYEEINAAF
ncbi:MAG: hypothetical protein ACOYXT_09465 [Bacteroidota bacterium]